MKCRLRVLDVSIALSGPDEIVGPIVRAYRRFVVSDAENWECTAPDGH